MKTKTLLWIGVGWVVAFLAVMLLIGSIGGCAKQAGGGRLDLRPLADAIAREASVIYQDAEAIEAVAARSEDPQAPAVASKALNIQRSATTIKVHAGEVKDAQKTVDKMETTIAKQEKAIADAKAKKGQQWTWLILGGVGALVAAAVMLYLGSRVLAGALAVAGGAAIVLGWLLPVVLAVAGWVLLGLAILAVAGVGVYVYLNRKALLELVKGTALVKAILPADIKAAVFGDTGIMASTQSPTTEALVDAIRPDSDKSTP